MPKAKRVNKSKKDIVSDFHQIEDAKRRRSLIKDIVFPHLIDIGESIGYSKIFLQSFSGLMERTLEEERKVTTFNMIYDKMVKRLESIFTLSDPNQKKEYERYLSLLDKIKDVSVQDFTYAAQLPTYIDGYIAKDKNKESIKGINIDELLG